MANRFWVGGTATWDATAGSKWSGTSGGAGGSSAPGAGDNVFFDANSGAVTITTSGSRSCRSLDCTGFTGTLAHNGTGISVGDASGGALTLVSGMTYSGSGTWNFLSTSNNGGSGWTITTAGKSLGGPIILNGVGGKWVLGDAFTTTGEFRLTNGTFDTLNFNMTLGQLSSSNSNTRTLTLGTSTITLSQSAASFATPIAMLTVTNLTFSGANATVIISAADASARTLNLGGKTWGTLTYTVASSVGALIITGANTFTTINVSGGVRTLTLPASTTTTITNFNVFGTAGNLVIINSSTALTAATLSKASGTVSTVDYVTLQDSTATGGAAFYAGSHSTNVSGNTGWSFTDAAVTVTGSQATETDTANTGSATVVAAGSQVAETDTANAGSAFIRPAGTQAAENDTANSGTADLRLSGSQSAETDTANGGAINVALPGLQAAESDTANAGGFLAVIGYGSYSGGYLGGSAFIVAGTQAAETDTANAGSSTFAIEGAHLTEGQTANAGTAFVFTVGVQVAETNTATGTAGVIFAVDGSQAEEVTAAFAGVAVGGVRELNLGRILLGVHVEDPIDRVITVHPPRTNATADTPRFGVALGGVRA